MPCQKQREGGRDNREVEGNQPTGSEATMFPILASSGMATSSYQLQLLVDLGVGGSFVAILILQHSEGQRLLACWRNGQSKQRMEHLREMALLQCCIMDRYGMMEKSLSWWMNKGK